MVNVGILGGTGYTGVELLRLLLAHPAVELHAVTSRAEAGKKLADLFPNLRGHTALTFTAPEDGWARGCDVVFSAAPNGVCMQQARALVKAGIKIIDLAADFRLKDAAAWEKWYGTPHACPELLKDAVYGLPETNRDKIRNATLVANPGCYPTAVQLGLLPLLEAGAVDATHLIADAKSGISGAGRKMEQHLMYAEASETMKAYAVAGHRHLPEICQGLEQATGQSVGITFVPHLAPMVRGIHATLYARLLDSGADVQALYERRYRAEPFVDVMPPGSHPETRSVRGANLCRLAIHRPQAGNTVVVLAVIDNLVKGAAGQAVQNFNIMVGLQETTGLGAAALVP